MANPILNEKFLENERVLDSAPMTVSGTINKSLILFIALFIAAIYTFSLMAAGFADKAQMLTIGGAVVGFVVAMIMAFCRKTSWFKFLAPTYAIAEGFCLGGVSAFFEAAWAGIVSQAVLGTMLAVFFMLGFYKTGLIKVNQTFRSVLFISTSSIFAIYIIQIIASLFGRSIPQIFTASPIGIGFSILVVVVASLNLLLDFDFIERGANNMQHKDFEWYGAFGLMVTIVWLYLEILRLLAKLNSRD